MIRLAVMLALASCATPQAVTCECVCPALHWPGGIKLPFWDGGLVPLIPSLLDSIPCNINSGAP